MVTGTLKNYTDENIIELIESLKAKAIAYNLSDLKAVLAEVNNRHLEGDYAEVLGELIRDKILNGDSTPAPAKEETVVAPAINEEQLEEVKKPKKEKKEKVKSVQEKKKEKDEEIEIEEDKYPVLSFVTGFLKVLGWISMAVSVIYGMYNAIANNLASPGAAISSIFTGLLVGTVVLLVCYVKAEEIALKMDIENHLSKLNEK